MTLQTTLCAAALSLLVTPAAEAAKPRPHTPPQAAASADRYGTQASYRTGAAGHGYSARVRHIADCLASYRGYDPRTDKVVSRGGETRRCDL